MNRPKKQEFTFPTHIDEYPTGPQYKAGFLPETNAGWRSVRPLVDHEACVFCLRCYLLCPDGTILKENGKIEFDMDYCKGCGVCAYECPKDAIKMVKE
ncbi:4Fe-4S dicluster domain-containing protein [Labilibaculum sp. A4]|uniref:4Fe-4S dicluster domain-containing protein n=1 Tax=Labilibaculum euxinus TaxID=2686357 RepID=A0A425Y9E3_9BACT|nr:4Fe-4S binding protein [Labilibaculum euxinus]MDQ1769951.1 4Fe-4S binding protein [Labilibaculum euxinus]MUP39914.1 4Fe-4S dicluster domain-containing protein [Labilibaculum euxinus]MVB09119.1 4Fe-4S dicluster domain-containing protein [Labilibaculum euxinus]MWN77373.1 4Fe-4S dicluster domain-containing protein [Labilibaculum euxinus]